MHDNVMLLHFADGTYAAIQLANFMSTDSYQVKGWMTVVVTATRTPKALKDIPVVTRVITAEDIQKVDATNVKDMLQLELTEEEKEQLFHLNAEKYILGH